MFLAMLRRLTAANVAVILALVFAMSGGAWAAKKYIITSTSQIKPSVIASLKKGELTGKAGPEGPPGVAGPAGARGDQGPRGLMGATGEKGEPGAQGATGAAGVKGATGPIGGTGQQGPTGPRGATGDPWTPANALPSGASETGSWFARPGEGEEAVHTLSFPVALSAELDETHVHFAPDPACSGTAKKPTAAAGNLCVYVGENFENHVELSTIIKPYEFFVGGAGTAGAVLVLKGTALPALAWGTWAVTAP